MKSFFKRSLVPSLALALVLQLWPWASARAQQPQVSDEQAKERLSFIETALNGGKPNAKTWYYGWLAGYSASAVTMGILAGVHWDDTTLEGTESVPDQEFAQDMLVGGATFALGAAGLLLDPFVPAYASKKVGRLPDSTPEERQLKLERAEAYLRACAKREVRGRSLTTHLLNIGVNAAAGIVTSAAFHRPWTDGLSTFAVGEVISLVTIFTQPMRATHDLANYEAKYLGKTGTVVTAEPERKWTLSAWAGGFTFRYEF